MNEPGRLTDILRDLAREDAGQSAPPHVEHAVMKAFRARSRGRIWPVGLAAAAALLIGAGLSVYWPRTAQVVEPEPEPAEIATEYLPLRAGPLLDPGEIGQVIRMQVPRGEMVRFGLALEPRAPSNGGETVGADVLVGMDGTARAVRFVH